MERAGFADEDVRGDAMKFQVMVDAVKYEIEAESEAEACALAVRYFARDHDSSRPERGRIKSCEVVE